MRQLLILAGIACLASCSDPQGAREAVEAYGLTDVQTTGYQVLGCSDHDTVHTGFTAQNVRGQRVEGVVCSDFGPFGKAATVRIFRVTSSAAGNVPLVSQ